ncbi:hypothetical protein I633_04470 [Alteromonas mediterranea 615]|uniref:Uncharacterized protein n=1 Tax=Alteromonas mediterranea 615 TaxID=1300253 RepID=S5AEP8_9ALTE|nr:hypothetical protein I633_04470 [Alteromonas mediterranea 615]
MRIRIARLKEYQKTEGILFIVRIPFYWQGVQEVTLAQQVMLLMRVLLLLYTYKKKQGISNNYK